MNFFVRCFKKLFSVITSSKFILGLSLVLNVLLWVLLIIFLGTTAFLCLIILSFVAGVLVLIFSKDDVVYKFSWLVLMTIVPLFGAVFYIYMRTIHLSKRISEQWTRIHSKSIECIYANPSAILALDNDNSQQKFAYYLQNTTSMPVYNHAITEYYSSGEDFFKSLYDELEKAERYIYLEFFIIRHGKVWTKILNILKERASQGVEVRILYDDFGCLDVFTQKQKLQIKKYGIQMSPFNKIKPNISRYINYRDHRKIVVIDGRVAFTGGINIGDEYANEIERFGYWRDTGIMIKNDGIEPFLALFAENWQIATGEIINQRAVFDFAQLNKDGDEVVQIFGSSPIASQSIAKDNYNNLINSAKEHIYISTPYLVLDDTIVNSLINASLSGVKVKILLPGIPDKRIVYSIGQTFFPELLKNGVEIYELTDSFNHAKMMEIDGETASIGTANFDFRSLCLHFEDTVMLYNSPTIDEIRLDFEDTFKKAKKLELETLPRKNFFKRMGVAFIKLFMPFL